MENLRATVKSVVYRSEKGWTVLRVSIEGRDLGRDGEENTVVGMFGHLTPGSTVEFRGEWVNSNRFGRQFDARSCQTVEPTSAAGIRAYLETLDQCGPSRARAIVDLHGAESLSMIWGSIDALLEAGIHRAAAEAIRENALERRDEAEAIVALSELKIPQRFHARLITWYGSDAADVVRKDPYHLIKRLDGVGFKTADEIAKQSGIALASPARIHAGILHVLGGARGEGHMYLTLDQLMRGACPLLGLKADTIEEQLAPLELEREIVIDGAAIYLERYHRAEEEVAADLLRIAGTPASKDPREAVYSIVPFELDGIQREAVEAAREKKVLIITGGPGTGKTTICRVILTAFQGQQVRLASPTGRAAKRLSEATGRPAETIHRLLEYHPLDGWRRNRSAPLLVDLVLLDEVSMVDTVLMSRLLEAVPDGARLIMVGDADQLPSVGPGKVLGDMIESGVVDVVELTQIKRQGESSRIVMNAHRVNSGLPLDLPANGEESDLYLIRRQDKVATAELAVDLATQMLPERFGFDPLEDVWVLSPQNKGDVGVDELNKRLQDRMNPDGRRIPWIKKRDLRVGDRVMQWKNDYGIQVYNGEVGRVKSFDAESEMAVVTFDQDRDVTYDKACLSNLRLAYATTIHKSQGSEYPCVVLIAHRTHYRMLQRPLLYTGMTRARQMLVIVGQEDAVRVATATAGRTDRNSGLVWRLTDSRPPSPPEAVPADPSDVQQPLGDDVPF